MKLWERYVGRRRRKARERYLYEQARDQAAGWETDPQRAIRDAGSKIASKRVPQEWG